MISKYKKISIIYGGSGLKCAQCINDKLNELHSKDLYPIKCSIVANQILDGRNIFNSVKNAISKSDLCIIILTFDDIDNTRIRQNVLIELGMALMTVSDTNNCIFLSEKTTLPDDFPSDLKWINANYFDKNNPDEIAEKVSNNVIDLLKSNSYKNLLSASPYIYDYQKILFDIPSDIFEERSNVQLEHILECWEKNIESFDFVSERIMYLSERLKFFPDFNCNDKFFSFLEHIKQLINPTELDYDDVDKVYLNNACRMVTNVIDYTILKLKKNVINCLNEPTSNSDESEIYSMQFGTFAENLKSFIEYNETLNEHNRYNWLLMTIAYEYVALACMKVINLKNSYSDNEVETINYVISCYNNVIKISNENSLQSAGLFLGYAQYDLTRAYEALYQVTKDKSIFGQIQRYSSESILTRQNWCNVNSFKGIFSNALSFEYFLVKKYELELRHKLKGYSKVNKKDMLKELNKLDDELKLYCDSVELGRLFDMKESIDELKRKFL